MAMNAREKDAMAKQLAVDVIFDSLVSAGGRKIDDYTYAVPVMVEDEPRFAKVSVTACLAKDTKTHKAFDIEEAVNAYSVKVDERVAKAEAKAAEKAAKEAAKTEAAE